MNMKAIKKMAQKYNIDLLVLYGSRVSGKTHQESDYDFGYLSKKTLSIKTEGKLILDLASALKLPVEKVELVSLRGASPLFLKEVFTTAKVIYARNPIIFDRYKIYALRYFEEFEPYFEQMVKILDRRMKEYKKELSLL